MKLWLISQDANSGYDTFDALVVAAKTEGAARLLHPEGVDADWDYTYTAWCRTPDQVEVELIGNAKPGTKEGIILASFNAG